MRGGYLTFGFMVNVEQNGYDNSNKNYDEYKSQTRFHGKVMAHISILMIINYKIFSCLFVLLIEDKGKYKNNSSIN